MAGRTISPPWRRDAEIFFVSVLILYLELVLIRWIGTEIRVFAYLGNLILVVCFFGVGLGCYQAERPVRWSRLGLNVFLLAVLIANPLHIEALNLKNTTQLLSTFQDSALWGGGDTSARGVLGGFAIVGVLTYLIVCTFVPAGQVLGRAFDDHPRVIGAYSINIAGSLVGAWLFNVLSWLSSPPAVWFAVVALLLVPLAAGKEWRRWLAVALAGLSCGVVWLGGASSPRTIWSPYHRLTVLPCYAGEGTNRVQQGYLVDVNDTFYQHIFNLSDSFLRAHPAVFDMQQVAHSHYNLPFCFKPGARSMLIVGAGTGNDAAAALRHGVEQVDCVEIDPRIYALGRELHPERPYDSPHVRMIVNDARAFFKLATNRYDIIWFGLLDSHTLGSSYNNLRLDHYVYTRESLLEAKRLLADDGVLIVSFSAERPWILDRLYGLLREVFGHAPLAYSVRNMPHEFDGGANVTLVAATTAVDVNSVADPSLRDFVRAHLISPPGVTRLTTDDWPYLYLPQAGIPKFHLVVSLAILGAVAVARRRVFGPKRGLAWHFFWLGAAFLLLEVQTVSRAMLLFGMTWMVNAIVISAVLVMALLANLVAARWPRFPQWLTVSGLAVSVLALAVVPLDSFNALAGASKLVAASAFLTAPVFFAGLVFIRSFAICADKSRALGSNLIGALVGGLLESVSFITGIRALIVLVGLFYAAALWLRPTKRGAEISSQ